MFRQAKMGASGGRSFGEGAARKPVIDNPQAGDRLHFMAASQGFQGGEPMVDSQLYLRRFVNRVRGKHPLQCWMVFVLLWVGGESVGRAQEIPYFVTYHHHMEEPGNLEIEFEPTIARPRGGSRFFSGLIEFEYATTAWWTTEVYLRGQNTVNDSTVFSGFSVENRFRVLPGKHRVNPVLYVEYVNVSADKTLSDVVGFDSQGDGLDPNSVARRDVDREVETRLILSSDFKGWNISENFIGEKNLAHQPWEFGYTLGIGRALDFAASPFHCNACPQNFRTGVELYGGLGTADRFTLHATSQYIAPVLAWSLANGPTFRISPSFGLTKAAYHLILRLGVSYEFPEVGRRVRQLFAGRGR